MAPPLPRRGAPAARLTVREAAARAARRGHPWVYRDAIEGPLERHEPGDVVELASTDGAFLARAVIDPTSPIAARILCLDAHRRIDDAWVADRIDDAVALRDALVDGRSTTAMRLCNGEGDGLPGLVIDRYGPWAVLRTDGPAAAVWAARLRGVLLDRLRAAGLRGIALRGRGEGVDLAWAGDRLPDRVVVTEHDVKLEVDLAQGQKTGAFLDQRENRRRVRALAAGRRALNLFSYAGGFSVSAALGGAPQVTSVDIAAGGHASAQRSFRENDLDPSRHRFVTSDAFVFLDAARARGERWGLVVCDPPSFAPSEKTKPRALAAYRKLHAACAAVLEPGGLLCAASCSSHVGPEEFVGTLDDLVDLRLVELLGQPPDHPTTPAWVEGRYLKMAVLVRRGGR